MSCGSEYLPQSPHLSLCYMFLEFIAARVVLCLLRDIKKQYENQLNSSNEALSACQVRGYSFLSIIPRFLIGLHGVPMVVLVKSIDILDRRYWMGHPYQCNCGIFSLARSMARGVCV